MKRSGTKWFPATTVRWNWDGTWVYHWGPETRGPFATRQEAVEAERREHGDARCFWIDC